MTTTTGLTLSPRIASAMLNARRAAVAYCDARNAVTALKAKRQTKAVKAQVEAAETNRAAKKAALEAAHVELLRTVYGAFVPLSDDDLERIANG